MEDILETIQSWIKTVNVENSIFSTLLTDSANEIKTLRDQIRKKSLELMVAHSELAGMYELDLTEKYKLEEKIDELIDENIYLTAQMRKLKIIIAKLEMQLAENKNPHFNESIKIVSEGTTHKT